MKSAAARLPPLDPNLAPHLADADDERRRDALRRLIATGSLSPSRQRLAAAELREIETLPHARAA